MGSLVQTAGANLLKNPARDPAAASDQQRLICPGRRGNVMDAAPSLASEGCRGFRTRGHTGM